MSRFGLPKNYRGFEVKYIGPTNILGSRFKVTDTRRKESVTFPYDYNYNTILDMALNYLKERGIKVNGVTHNEKTHTVLILSSDFKTDLKN